jgi:hypothetical protein
MARSIGITYEECARLMKKLETIVQYGRGGRVVILNQANLEAIAAGEIDLNQK